jgi:hypothetical protein
MRPHCQHTEAAGRLSKERGRHGAARIVEITRAAKQRKCWSIWVNGNWRLTFTFDGEDAILVDYQDYH